MILPPAPRSAHQLVVFTVEAAIARRPGVRRAVTAVADHARATYGPTNHVFGWVLFDDRPRAVGAVGTDPPGALIEAYAARTPDPPPPGSLDAGLAIAYQVGWDFAHQHADDLPVVVDVLVAVDPDCPREAAAFEEIGSDRRMQVAITLVRPARQSGGEPPTSPATRMPTVPSAPAVLVPPRREIADLRVVDGTDPDALAMAWTAALARLAVRRQPAVELG